jgi:thiosulfate/3-mercaptopyruvate sulfurtransferase
MHTATVSTDLLAKHLTDPNWVVVDTRFDLGNAEWGRQSYAAAHIPGAWYMDLDGDLAGTKTGRNGRHPLPDPDQFAARLGAMGITAGKQVVVYDQGTMMFVGRLWWMLKWLGHDNVAVLDGGYAAWEREQRVVSSAQPLAKPAVFTPRVSSARLVTADAVLSGLAQRAHILVDARSPERYRGDNEPIDPVAGHIPGARNRPFSKNLGPDGKLLPAADLRAEFDAVLEGKAATAVVHSCGSGVSALANMIAMEHAGLPGSRLYAGSWSEWSSDPSRPVEKG